LKPTAVTSSWVNGPLAVTHIPCDPSKNSDPFDPFPSLSGVNLMGNLGGPNFESLIHKTGHDKTSDTVEDNLY